MGVGRNGTILRRVLSSIMGDKDDGLPHPSASAGADEPGGDPAGSMILAADGEVQTSQLGSSPILNSPLPLLSAGQGGNSTPSTTHGRHLPPRSSRPTPHVRFFSPRPNMKSVALAQSLSKSPAPPRPIASFGARKMVGIIVCTA